MDKKLIKVLLVEDDLVDRQVVERALAKTTSYHVRFNVDAAATMSGAAESLRTKDYDVLLLDLNLPDSKGVDTVEEIRKVNSGIPVIVLTGTVDEETGLETIKKGAEDYLVKGKFSGDELVRTIRYAIERNAIERKIENAAREWRTTFDSINDLIVIVDGGLKILRANKAFAKAFGAQPWELLGKNYHDVFYCDSCNRADCAHIQTIKTKEPVTIEFYNDRLKTHFEITAAPVFDDKGKVEASVLVAKDITGRKLAEENMRKANEKLKEYNELKDEFVSTVSHELRTPLSIIQSAIRLVLDEIPGKIVDKQREVLTTAIESVKWLTKIVNFLLTISKIESGKMDLQKIVVDICKLIEDIVSEYKPLAQERALSLDCELPEQNINICLDPDKIRQVLINLISNSIKFTPEGGQVRVACTMKDEEVQFSVQDSGVGIAKEDMRRLFDKFTQFNRKPGSEEKGTGLGLAIVKKLVEMHNGRIDVESAIDQGTTFTISLPLTSIAKVEDRPGEMDELVETVLGN